MKALSSYAQYINDELLSDMPGILLRRMFSGYGVYKDGIIFGMIIKDVLYFKTDDTNKENFLHAGSKPFSFTHKNGKEVTTSYYEVPAEVMEEKEKLAEWIDQSVKIKK